MHRHDAAVALRLGNQRVRKEVSVRADLKSDATRNNNRMRDCLVCCACGDGGDVLLCPDAALLGLLCGGGADVQHVASKSKCMTMVVVVVECGGSGGVWSVKRGEGGSCRLPPRAAPK